MSQFTIKLKIVEQSTNFILTNLNINKKTIAPKSLLIILVLSLKPTISFSKEIKAQPFIEIKASKQQLETLCKEHHLDCGENLDGIHLWQVKNHTNSKKFYYATDLAPQLVKFHKKTEKYIIVNRWDFSNYQHNNKEPQSAEPMGPSFISIHPAFYPLNKKQVAIAVINGYGASYSGGGAVDKIADFVQLSSNGKYRVAIKNIPFYYWHMYRACFSGEYATSPHCHQEAWSILQIQFTDVGKRYYQWTLKYTDKAWGAHKPKNAMSVKHRKSLKVMPFSKKLIHIPKPNRNIYHDED